jgi:hypothetical protein
VTPVRRVRGLCVIAAAVLATVLLAGCKVDTRVEVTMRRDGSGTVKARIMLDAQAVQRLTADVHLDRAVPLADVRAAGWKVSPWVIAPHGGRVLTLTHDFVDQADLEQRLVDLSGPKGILGGARITRSHGWFRAKESITIAADLRHVGAGVRSDPKLAARLRDAGLDLGTLDAQLRSRLNQSLRVTIYVIAPDGESNIVHLTAGNRGSVTAWSEQTDTTRIVLLAAGVGILFLEIVVMAVILVTRWRRRRTS